MGATEGHVGAPSPHTRQEYHRRINAALRLIDRELASEIPLSRLAAEARFSAFHFHRIFTALVGETPADLVRRLRLEKAAGLLLLEPPAKITTVALACGFSTSALFCRVFREHFGLSPTQWRVLRLRKKRQPERKKRKDGGGHPRSHWDMGTPPTIRIEELPAVRVAYVAHRTGYGDAAGIARAFQELFAWAGPRGVLGPDRRVLGIPLDNPDITPKGKCRYYAGVSVIERARAEGKVGVMDLRPGKYAVGRFSGTERIFSAAYGYLYGQWLPRSGWQPDDAPCFESYLGEPGAGRRPRFTFDLYVPLRPM